MKRQLISFSLLIGFLGGCASSNIPEETRGSVNSVSACAICHGSAENAAPPRNLDGEMDVTARGVGAHQAHLTAGTYSDPVACNECHAVPVSVLSTGHLDSDLPAEITFGALSKTGSLTPEWDGAVCDNTYCHGASLAGGSSTTPNWAGGTIACGGCHGIPPASPPHQARLTDCSDCHSQVMGPGQTFVNKALHINGAVNIDTNLPCNTCHGGVSNAAPPVDVAGNSATTFTSVGAHQAHVVEGAITSAIPCSECHVEPALWNNPGHLDDGSLSAEINFGTRAGTNGYVITGFWTFEQTDPRNPGWNSVTCADTYCHNPTNEDTSPGKVWAPTWTVVDGSQAQCTSCHGYPPWTHDPAYTFCRSCHASVVGLDHMTIIDKTKHVNGQIEN